MKSTFYVAAQTLLDQTVLHVQHCLYFIFVQKTVTTAILEPVSQCNLGSLTMLVFRPGWLKIIQCAAGLSHQVVPVHLN